jgi:hypothetical protein
MCGLGRKCILREKMGMTRKWVREKWALEENMGPKKGRDGEKMCPWDGQWHVRRWAQRKDGA